MPNEIECLSMPEILAFIDNVIDKYVYDSLPKLKCKAMTTEIQKRMNLLWGKKT